MQQLRMRHLIASQSLSTWVNKSTFLLFEGARMYEIIGVGMCVLDSDYRANKGICKYKCM